MSNVNELARVYLRPLIAIGAVSGIVFALIGSYQAAGASDEQRIFGTAEAAATAFIEALATAGVAPCGGAPHQQGEDGRE